MSDQKKATYQIQPFPSLQPSAAMLDRKELCTASCAAVGNMWGAAACAELAAQSWLRTELAAHRAGCAQSWLRTELAAHGWSDSSISVGFRKLFFSRYSDGARKRHAHSRPRTSDLIRLEASDWEANHCSAIRSRPSPNLTRGRSAAPNHRNPGGLSQ